MIGVTGASGHLGSVILELLPDAVPIGREIPDIPFEAVIHTAAPDYRDDAAVAAFVAFNLQLAHHLRRHPVEALVVTGSWWQHAVGSCTSLPYTLLKASQTALFPQAVHLLPYSIYGDDARQGRGFVPQLIQAIRGESRLVALSTQLRDFIHVRDVALAHIRALDVRDGVYAVCTGVAGSPMDLARLFGLQAMILADIPSAHPRYLAPALPDWSPTIDVVEHIRARI